MARSSKAFVNCFSKPFSPIMSSGFWYSASSLSSSSFSIAIGSPLSSFPMAVYTICFTPSPWGRLHLLVSSSLAAILDAPERVDSHSPGRAGVPLPVRIACLLHLLVRGGRSGRCFARFVRPEIHYALCAAVPDIAHYVEPTFANPSELQAGRFLARELANPRAHSAVMVAALFEAFVDSLRAFGFDRSEIQREHKARVFLLGVAIVTDAAKCMGYPFVVNFLRYALGRPML